MRYRLQRKEPHIIYRGLNYTTTERWVDIAAVEHRVWLEDLKLTNVDYPGDNYRIVDTQEAQGNEPKI